MKKSVLFLCTGNSARSQMAEILLKHLGGDTFEVFSAGAKPEPVHPATYQVLKKFGIGEGALYSKSVDQLPTRAFDYVITLCEHASAECRDIPYIGKRLEWHFPDPKGSQEQTTYDTEAFESCLHSLRQRISSFIQLETGQQPPASSSLSPTTLFKSLSDELRLKCLMLVQYEGELCVCELMAALEDSQPKVSRHLALLREQGILSHRRSGQWVFYRLNPDLPEWARSILATMTDANIALIHPHLSKLYQMGQRPSRSESCC